MPLIEQCRDLVPYLEACHAVAYGLYNAGAVGGGDDGEFECEGVLAFGDDEVAVVEGGGLELDKYVFAAELGDLDGFLEVEAVEAVRLYSLAKPDWTDIFRCVNILLPGPSTSHCFIVWGGAMLFQLQEDVATRGVYSGRVGKRKGITIGKYELYTCESRRINLYMTYDDVS